MSKVETWLDFKFELVNSDWFLFSEKNTRNQRKVACTDTIRNGIVFIDNPDSA